MTRVPQEGSKTSGETRKPYQTPELMDLGLIASLIRTNTQATGGDASLSPNSSVGS